MNLEETLDAIIPELKKNGTIREIQNRIFRSAVKSAYVSNYGTERALIGATNASEWSNMQYQLGRLTKELKQLVPSYCDLKGEALV